jgi:DNA-binding transcriptional ArsR family regulator
MDRLSAAAVARELGTSVPRVKRAIERLGLEVREGRHGRVELTRSQVESLRRELGVGARFGDLSGTQVQVLTALARAPLGLVSVRAVARRAGVSPTAASRALGRLTDRGLVRRQTEWVSAGRAQRMDVYRAAFDAAEWPQLAPRLTPVRPPARLRPEQDRRVPAHLRHLFWNTASSQLDPDHAGGYIAQRLLTARDPAGIAWGIEQLQSDDWEKAAQGRGLDASQRSLARNIAKSRRERPRTP